MPSCPIGLEIQTKESQLLEGTANYFSFFIFWHSEVLVYCVVLELEVTIEETSRISLPDCSSACSHTLLLAAALHPLCCGHHYGILFDPGRSASHQLPAALGAGFGFVPAAEVPRGIERPPRGGGLLHYYYRIIVLLRSSIIRPAVAARSWAGS